MLASTRWMLRSSAGRTEGATSPTTASSSPRPTTLRSNAAVFDDAEAAGVWVNSADDIENCSFTLPAIHRDGAITVAVSTEGQSPAFAAWLRDRVRDALPVGLADVATQIANERRAVHERGETTEGLDWRTRIDELVDAPASVGTVHLVGAGPGDPELLTLRAARLLAAADVVVHDALADTEALSLVPSHVERIDVGKRPGRPVPQELINDLLVQLAQRHRCVVRLKGGDPFLFGRGGEEALALQAAGVAFEVVPGITSAIAAPAAAGVPVTQRGMSASVTIVTGHRRFGDEDETDWEALARVGGTIVVLMGVAERGAIAAATPRRWPLNRHPGHRRSLRHAARARGGPHDARRARRHTDRGARRNRDRRGRGARPVERRDRSCDHVGMAPEGVSAASRYARRGSGTELEGAA